MASSASTRIPSGITLSWTRHLYLCSRDLQLIVQLITQETVQSDSTNSESAARQQPMTDSPLSPPWVDDLLSGVALDSSLFDQELESASECQFTDTEPWLSTCWADSAVAATAGEREPNKGKQSATPTEDTVTRPTAIDISRNKLPGRSLKSSRFPGVRTDAARRVPSDSAVAMNNEVEANQRVMFTAGDRAAQTRHPKTGSLR